MSMCLQDSALQTLKTGEIGIKYSRHLASLNASPLSTLHPFDELSSYDQCCAAKNAFCRSSLW